MHLSNFSNTKHILYYWYSPNFSQVKYHIMSRNNCQKSQSLRVIKDLVCMARSNWMDFQDWSLGFVQWQSALAVGKVTRAGIQLEFSRFHFYCGVTDGETRAHTFLRFSRIAFLLAPLASAQEFFELSFLFFLCYSVCVCSNGTITTKGKPQPYKNYYYIVRTNFRHNT